MIEQHPPDPYVILTRSPLQDDRTRVLKYGETFAVFGRGGAFEPLFSNEHGLYHEGTRRLSLFQIRIEDRPPLLLSSEISTDNGLLLVDLTNADVMDEAALRLPRDTIHLWLGACLSDGCCHCRLHFRSYALHELTLSWSLAFGADFFDVFEVRGTRRARRGTVLPPRVGKRSATLCYQGLDHVPRETRLEFDVAPTELVGGQAKYVVHLPPKGDQTVNLTIDCAPEQKRTLVSFDGALETATAAAQAARDRCTWISTSNDQFNDWLHRSSADLHTMVSNTPYGPYPYAGVPWFSTPFGRDGIIAAWEYLWVDPELARGVLHYLAATQAHEIDPTRDAEPGKILHESRQGEMAALGEIPFGRYYGAADSTPLFVMLAHAYYQRTGDRALIAELWPNIEAALRWIDNHADLDGDGFFEFQRQSSRGLVVQGWKDSSDSVFHEDGQLAEAPLALCEIQGYVYAAWRGAAALAELLSLDALAVTLRKRSDKLQVAFDEKFWCEDLGAYALALDAHKQPCRVRTSNAGHVLFAGLALAQRAERVVDLLTDDVMYSGWGVRTVATVESRYNPMSYHNGSIWPHDNALIAQGMSRYGYSRQARTLLTGLFDTARNMDLHRLPELFCGFARRADEGPTRYPVACSPQAWAAGAPFLLLQACIGLEIDAPRRRVAFHHPVLPEFLQHIHVRNLRVGDASVELVIERHPDNVGVKVLDRKGDIEVVTVA